MPRAIHFLVSSSGIVSSLLHRWKPHISGGISSTPISVKSLSTSRRAATQQFFPEFSASRSDFLRAFRVPATCSDSYADGGSSSPPPPTFQPLAHLSEVSFCQWCGGPMKQAIPDGDEKKRAICTLCGKISYRNPKMVVGCLVEHDNKVLLCKRNIPPSYGLWTLPSGYMEIGESALEGAIRETWEEAGADVEVLSPFAQLDIPLIGQTYIFFRARLKKPQFAPGPESLDCQLFALKDIPFDSLAFSSMLVTLNMYAEDLKTGKPKFHYGTINKRPDSGPSDIHAFTVDCHLQS